MAGPPRVACAAALLVIEVRCYRRAPQRDIAAATVRSDRVVRAAFDSQGRSIESTARTASAVGWGAAHVINQALSLFAHIPFVAFDTARVDARLRQWRERVLEGIRSTGAKPDGFPLKLATVIVLPYAAPLGGSVLLDETCNIPTIELPEYIQAGLLLDICRHGQSQGERRAR